MTASRDREWKSSAVTLSDMEVFIFPDLIYALLLANIMSPRIWRWLDDPWFRGIERLKPHRRIQRLKQYIMDHYVFNLDLDTWGLTTQDREIKRFSDFIDTQALRQSNALFGYAGDKYYFDIDIRTHFGLDRYDGEVIPYWKTETVEAMDAFRFKPGMTAGAGECVSLSVLYAAALFIVARIPLDDIFLMATPLHSQNFIDVADGILTNNRRLVTKTMWFNGTEISAQARRALENERITLVAHASGVIHTLYPEASMDPAVYVRFADKLRSFLSVDFNEEILGNFLRQHSLMQRCFQIRWPLNGVDRYIAAERVFAYEHNSSFRFTDDTSAKLMQEIDAEEFHSSRLPRRMLFNDWQDFVRLQPIDLGNPADVQLLKQRFVGDCLDADRTLEALIRFCRVTPRLPDATAKTFQAMATPLGLSNTMTRAQVIARLEAIRDQNPMAQAAFYAYRDLGRCEPQPFLIAAMQRNPVAISALQNDAIAAVANRLQDLPAESIYDEPHRLAQPDEVWNYQRGVGIEKALLLAAVLHARHPEGTLAIRIAADNTATVTNQAGAWMFPGVKGLAPQTWQLAPDITVVSAAGTP